eukprot:g36929.t1
MVRKGHQTRNVNSDCFFTEAARPAELFQQFLFLLLIYSIRSSSGFRWMLQFPPTVQRYAGLESQCWEGNPKTYRVGDKDGDGDENPKMYWREGRTATDGMLERYLHQVSAHATNRAVVELVMGLLKMWFHSLDGSAGTFLQNRADRVYCASLMCCAALCTIRA